MSSSMTDEQKDRLEKLVALTTAIIAVFLSISSILGSNADSDTLIFRGHANDQWSYYQSKSIKQNLYESNLQMLTIEFARPTNTGEFKKMVEEKIKNNQEKISKYETEKNEIKKKAEDFETLSEKSNEQGDVYDMAEGFYQIAIILAAVALIAKQKKMWLLSCLLGAVAVCITGYAYLLM